MSKRLAVYVVLTVAMLVPAQASNIEDEQVVRTAYAKLAYAAQSHAVYDEARKNPEMKTADLTKQLQDNALRFEIGDMTSGALSEIASKPYSDFVTKPDAQPVLEIAADEEIFDENGKRSVSLFAVPRWGRAHESQEDWITPVGKALEISGKAGKFSRYVAATITVRFQGESRTYRALWLLGSQTTLVVDLVAGQIAGEFATASTYPSVLTDTSLRSRTAVNEWLTATQRFESSCKTGKQDVCCDSAMHCGVHSEDLRSTKPAPNTTATPKGGI